MYKYDTFDRQFMQERVEQFRDQTKRFLNGEIPSDVYQQLRLRNGLYIERVAPMLRIAVPYGTLNSTQLRTLARITEDYDKGYAHLSTRQNVQFNWPRLEDVPDILAELAEVEMHAIQTSGSCVRNITTDQFAGVAEDENVDARPYSEILRQWITYHPEFEWLPRKFKIAINGADSDRAAIAVHDIGIQLHPGSQNGEALADFYVGGGQGRTPVIGSLIRERLEARHLLTYTEAILRVYNRYGRRDNKYKARIKILVRAMTPQVFKEKVDSEWEQIKNSPHEITQDEFDRIHKYFETPQYECVDESRDSLASLRLQDRNFDRWLKNNVTAHKQSGYAVVTLSTKLSGIPPGDVSAEQMLAVADWAESYGFGEVRISHDQNFILPDIPQKNLYELYQKAQPILLGSANIGYMTDVICCPGGDYCALANAKSIPVADEIQRSFDDVDYVHDLGHLDINISGCMNACGHHHVGHIGILGVDKKGEEWYQISLGGNSSNGASLGKIIGPSFSRDNVVPVLRRILDTYVDSRVPEESFLETYRRVGIEPFRESVYQTETASNAVN